MVVGGICERADLKIHGKGLDGRRNVCRGGEFLFRVCVSMRPERVFFLLDTNSKIVNRRKGLWER